MATILGARSTDAEILLAEIRKRPRGYIELRAMMAKDRDRALAALDELIAAGKVETFLDGTATHYRAVR